MGGNTEQIHTSVSDNITDDVIDNTVLVTVKIINTSHKAINVYGVVVGY
jgi:hypothetical protein